MIPDRSLKSFTMNNDQRFSLQGRIKSFYFAFQGIWQFFRTEHNALIHLSAAILVIILGVLTNVSWMEAALLAIVIAMVWISEMFNTCIEKAMDLVSLEYHPTIKFIKDLSAGAVCIAAIAAVVTGLVIFIPKFF